MSEWIEQPKKNPPPEMQLVEVKGYDCWGAWVMQAMKKTYVKPPYKKMRQGCWRWVDKDGERFCDQGVSAWRAIQ